MKKILLTLSMVLLLVVSGCSKEAEAKTAITIDINITNETNGFNAVLNIDESDKFKSLQINKNSALLSISDSGLKDKNILESVELVMENAVKNKVIDENTKISISVKAPKKRKDDLYRYIYKNALDPLVANNIDIGIDYKFNE